MRVIRIIIAASICLSTAAPAYAQGVTGTGTAPGPTVVTVTEKIPGMDCTAVVAGREGDPKTRLYKCKVERWFGSVMLLLSGLIKYGTFIIALIGVLMIVASGVQISMSGIDSGMREDAKTRITQVLTGLAFLFLVSMILNTVAPWVYQ